MTLPVLDEHFDKPSQGECLDDVLGPPTQIRSHQIAILGFASILKGDHKAFLAMRLEIQTCAADQDVDGLVTAATIALVYARITRKILFQCEAAIAEVHFLVATQLADDLHTAEDSPGPVQKGRCAVERIG